MTAFRDVTLSSPAQKMNSASGFLYKMRFTISPLLTAMGRTSRFFFPTSTIAMSGIELREKHKAKQSTFDGTFMCQIVLEEILTLSALELPTQSSVSRDHDRIEQYLPPFRIT